jgi:subtilisin family serine protease
MKRTGIVLSITLMLAIAFLVTALTTPANASPANYRIDLPVRSFTPDANQLQFFQQRDNTEPQSFLIQFSSHPSEASKAAMTQDGIHLQQYIGGGAWIAWMASEANMSALASADVRWAGGYLPQDRIAPRVTGQQNPEWAVAGDEIILAVQFPMQLDESTGEAILRSLGATVGDHIPVLNVWYAQMSLRSAVILSEDSQVLAIDYISPPMDMVNAGVRAALRVDEVNDPPFGLTGEGVTVCVYDGGISYVSHPDFEDRGTIGEPGGFAAHATHVAGTVLGNGAEAYRGMAPDALLIAYEYESCIPNCLYDSPQDIFENYQEALLTHGAHLFTNSIGANIYSNGYPCEWQGDYETVSALLDGIVRGSVGGPVIITWAAGNERGGGACGLLYDSMSVPSGAKNVITVGASDDNNNIASFSSWGPTDDGRIKPEVTAPGVGVVSCNNGGGYTTMSGTSMATPAVAGVNALLVQAWQQTALTEFPLPATVKAILCNAAEDYNNPGPDYVFGFGRVDAVRTIETVQNFGYLEASVGDNGVFSHDINVPAGMSELKVTAAWSDPPAAYLPPICLINNLDLTLVDPNGNTHLPFILDGANPSLPATTGINNVDVVEQVAVSNPMAGTWTMQMTGTDVPDGPQDFSVAANVPMAAGIMTVTGTVTNINNGVPIEGATVTLDDTGGGTTTDANGDYFMYLPISETSAVTAEAPGHFYQRAYIIPNENDLAEIDFQLHNRAVGQINGVVRTADNNPVQGATVTVEELPQLTRITNASGQFTFTLPTGDVFTLSSGSGNLVGEVKTYARRTQPVSVQLYLLEEAQQYTGPSQQVRYIAVQSGDGHQYAANFNWREIDPLAGGSGTRVTFTTEEDAQVVALPFTVGYYGNDYTELTVNENGFFCFGDVTADPDAADYSNSGIPDDDGPPAMVAPFWEDFKYDLTNVSYFHDAATGIFIIEWYNSRQWPEDGTLETFQVIFNDRDFPTPPPYLPYDENTRILFQYADVNDLGNATVGIESPDEQAGIQMLYFNNTGDGGYAPTASTILDGSTILFYVPRAKVQGHVELDVADPEVDITVSSEYGEITVGVDGNYSIDVLPGTFELSFSAPGYETLGVQFELNEYQQTTANPVTLAKLYPPMNVTYDDQGGSVIINWTAPIGGVVDDFLGYYRVYKDGVVGSLVQTTTWTDTNPNVDLNYWVSAIYAGGESDSSLHATPGVLLAGIGEDGSLLPEEFEIGQAYPNPFNPATSVRIALPEIASVKVAVFDVLGREVVRLANGETMPAGYHRLTWDADSHASGVYFLQVEAGPEKAVRKLVLLK